MADEQARNSPPLPSDALVIVPVRKMVLFPGLVAPITVGRPRSIAAAQQAVREQRQIGILMQRDAEVADPASIDLHRFGTVANVVRYMTAPDGSHHLICQGQERFQIVEFLNGWPFFVARVSRLPDQEVRSKEIEARFVNLRGQALEAAQLLPQAPEELVAAISNIATPGALADFTAGTMDISPEEKQEILETIDIGARIDKVSRLLAHRIEVLRLSQEIGRQTKQALDERQREVLLREQMAAIQKQLGEGDAGKSAEMTELGEAITKAKMPKDIEEQARRELAHRQVLDDPALDLVEPVVIFIEDAACLADIDRLLLRQIPRQLDQPVEIGAHHAVLGGRFRHALEPAQLATRLFLDILRHLGLGDRLAELGDLRALAGVALT